MKLTSRKSKRNLRHKRVRKKVIGNAERPRLSVFKSSRHIYVQVIDDTAMSTIFSVSTLTPAVSAAIAKDNMNKVDAAKALGKHVAELASSKGIEKVTFDRGGYKFHGRIKSLADAAREAGLQF